MVLKNPFKARNVDDSSEVNSWNQDLNREEIAQAKRKTLGLVLSRKGHQVLKNHNIQHGLQEKGLLKGYAMQSTSDIRLGRGEHTQSNGCTGQVWSTEIRLGTRGKPNCLGLVLQQRTPTDMRGRSGSRKHACKGPKNTLVRIQACKMHIRNADNKWLRSRESESRQKILELQQ